MQFHLNTLILILVRFGWSTVNSYAMYPRGRDLETLCFLKKSSVYSDRVGMIRIGFYISLDDGKRFTLTK